MHEPATAADPITPVVSSSVRASTPGSHIRSRSNEPRRRRFAPIGLVVVPVCFMVCSIVSALPASADAVGSGPAPLTASSSPTAALSNSAGQANDGFGAALAVSQDGTTALVGAPLDGSTAQGAVYVFHSSSGGPWTSSS